MNNTQQHDDVASVTSSAAMGSSSPRLRQKQTITDQGFAKPSTKAVSREESTKHTENQETENILLIILNIVVFKTNLIHPIITLKTKVMDHRQPMSELASN